MQITLNITDEMNSKWKPLDPIACPLYRWDCLPSESNCPKTQDRRVLYFRTWKDNHHPIHKVRLRKVRCEYDSAWRWRHSEPSSLASHPVITASLDYHIIRRNQPALESTGGGRELEKLAAVTAMEKRISRLIAEKSAVAQAAVNVAKAYYAGWKRERACCLDDSKRHRESVARKDGW